MARPAPIRVEGLNHHYGRGELKKQVLFDVSTEVQAGEIVIVTGPSGSGKTTLLTLVGALRSAQDGSVRVLGEELRAATPATLEKVRRQIGFVFQQYNLLDALSALQNVELGVRVSRKFGRSQLRRRAKQMLKAVGLEDRMHYKPQQLSGGQRQRVAIARALASRPAMVLADEPTASLDSQSGREVVDEIKTLARDNGTTGFWLPFDSNVIGNGAHGNGSDGFNVGLGSVLKQNTAAVNGASGIVTGGQGTLVDNVARQNDQHGIDPGDDSVLDGNVARDNNQSLGGFFDIDACATCVFSGLNIF